MSNVTRVALPGYDALTDTNLDHFSLYSDVDNVLIKRFLISTARITDGSPTVLTIAHNLGYIPFFLVHYFDTVTSTWIVMNNQYNLFSVPSQIAAADTTNLYIYNYGGHALGYVDVVYEIFYDNMNDTTAPALDESNNVYKVARPGKRADSTNPNDYIMHSDLNTFKIIKEGTNSFDVASRTNYSFAHGATVTTPYKYLLFLKSNTDGKTILLGGSSATKTYDEGTTFFGSRMDGTNITIVFPTQAAISDTYTVKYYIFGSGVSNTLPTSKPVLAVATPGSNALAETNPDNFTFHSAYSTLKYFTSDVYSMTVTNTTVHTIPHNLGYVPPFIVFVKDLAGIISNGYALLPYYFGRSSIPSPTRDVGAFAYADSTNLYLKAWYQANAIGTAFTFSFSYKLFKNNTGL